jgi:hypothetical protein
MATDLASPLQAADSSAYRVYQPQLEALGAMAPVGIAHVEDKVHWRVSARAALLGQRAAALHCALLRYSLLEAPL